MNKRIMSSISLNELVDARIYVMMREQQPGLVEAVRTLVLAGQTPAQIERRMRDKFGSRQTVRYVRHVANHIQRTEGQPCAS